MSATFCKWNYPPKKRVVVGHYRLALWFIRSKHFRNYSFAFGHHIISSHFYLAHSWLKTLCKAVVCVILAQPHTRICSYPRISLRSRFVHIIAKSYPLRRRVFSCQGAIGKTKKPLHTHHKSAGDFLSLQSNVVCSGFEYSKSYSFGASLPHQTVPNLSCGESTAFSHSIPQALGGYCPHLLKTSIQLLWRLNGHA